MLKVGRSLLRPYLLFGLLLWALVLSVVPGCSAAVSRIGPELAGAVVMYCAGVPQAERDLLRASINAEIAPHSVAVNCAGDEPWPDTDTDSTTEAVSGSVSAAPDISGEVLL